MKFCTIPLIFLLLLFPVSALPAETETLSSPIEAPTLSDRYRQVLSIDPDNLQLRYYLGIALLTEGKNDEAIAEFRKSYPAFIDSTEMNYNMGLALYQTGDLDSAVLYFEQAEDLGALDQLDIYPLINAYYNIGAAYLERDSAEDAARLFEKVLSIDPERHEIHRILGDIHSRRGAIFPAIREYGVFLSVYPNDSEALESLFKLYYNAGLQCLENKDFPGSRENLQRALETMPGSPLALYYLGYLDYAEGRVEDASSKLLDAYSTIGDEEIRKSIATLLYNCALTLTKQRKHRQALETITPLAIMEDSPLENLSLAGNIHLSLKEFNNALTYFNRIWKRNPSYPGLALNLIAAQGGTIDELFERGKFLLAEKRYLEAVEKLESAQAINPADPRIKNYIAKTRAEMESTAHNLLKRAETDLEGGDLQSALVMIRTALSYTPDSPAGIELEKRAMSALKKSLEESIAEGDSLLAQNDLDGAEKAFGKALEIDPQNNLAMEGVDAITRKRIEKADALLADGAEYLSEGNLADARKAYKAALLLRPDDVPTRKGLEKVDVLLASMVAEELHWGRLAKNAGQYQQAREHFSTALELSDAPEIKKELVDLDATLSSKIDGLIMKAEEALAAGDVKPALRYYQNILALIPEHTGALDGIEKARGVSDLIVQRELQGAKLDMAAGNQRSALDRYRKILDLDPANDEAKNGLARGKSLLEKHLSTLLAQGSSAMEKGSFATAEKVFREIIKIDPYHSGAKGGLDRIAQLKSVGAKPGDETQLYLQGIEYYTKGKYDKALALWEQVLIISPTHEKARMNIDKARRKMHQIQEFR